MADVSPSVLRLLPDPNGPDSALSKYETAASTFAADAPSMADVSPSVLGLLPDQNGPVSKYDTAASTSADPQVSMQTDIAATGRRALPAMAGGGDLPTGSASKRLDAYMNRFRRLSREDDIKSYYSARFRALVNFCVVEMLRVPASRDDLVEFSKYVDDNGYGLLTAAAKKVLPAAIASAPSVGEGTGLAKLIALGEELSRSTAYREMKSSFEALTPPITPPMTGGGDNSSAAVALTLLGALSFVVLQ